MKPDFRAIGAKMGIASTRRMVVASAVSVLFVLFSASPATAADTGDKLSASTEANFKLAARSFWENQGYDLTGSSRNRDVDCRPTDVKILYENNKRERRMQSAALNGAYRADVHPSQYCEILINRAYPEDLRPGCVAFIHEYGHLLGKGHNNNVHSPMYNGYTKYTGGRALEGQLLFIKNKKLLLAKSICSWLDPVRVPDSIARAASRAVPSDVAPPAASAASPPALAPPTTRVAAPPAPPAVTPPAPAAPPLVVPGAALVPYTLGPGHQCLLRNEFLRSKSGRYSLHMQADGEVVLSSPTRVLWRSNTSGTDGSSLCQLGNGLLVIWDSAVKPIWAAGTRGSGGDRLMMQDDGNLVMHTPAYESVWASNTSGQS